MKRLFKVSVFLKKEWMPEFKEFEFVTCSYTSDSAIQHILNNFDFSGVIIQKTVAVVIEENYAVLNVPF